jgi:translation initiation factor 3 subunit M
MASDAGQGNSGFAGEDKEGKGKGKETAILPPQSTTQGGNPVAYDEESESPPGDSELPSYRSALFLSKTQKFQDWNYTRRTCFIATLELKKHWEFYGSSPIWKDANSFKMASSPQLLFVDGSFAELAQEMADYIQVGEQVKSLLAKEQNEEALQAIVKASSYLNQVPEKEFTGAYNLLIHLVLQSSDYKKYLPAICGNLLKPITSSPTHGFTLAANALSTIFNLLDKTNPVRYHVFMQIVRFIRQHGQFDLLKPRLPNLEGWFAAWETDEEDKRRLYVEVADVAGEAGDDEYVTCPGSCVSRLHTD